MAQTLTPSPHTNNGELEAIIISDGPFKGKFVPYPSKGLEDADDREALDKAFAAAIAAAEQMVSRCDEMSTLLDDFHREAQEINQRLN